MNELKYFFTTREDGNMNTASRFFKEGMTREEIKNAFDYNRIKFGLEHGFDGRRIIVPIQKNSNNSNLYPDGKSVRITNEMITGYTDLYDLDIEADILAMDSSVSSTVLAYPVADCPVVFMYDICENAVSMAHCGAEYVNRELPSQMVDNMRETFDSRVENLYVYIGPYIHKESYTYETYPKWATNEQAWRECIYKQKGIYHIDLGNAIAKQLVDKGIDFGSIYPSAYDTATNDKFYSHHMSKTDPSKAGRFYEGCYFTEDVIKTLKYTKTR